MAKELLFVFVEPCAVLLMLWLTFESKIWPFGFHESDKKIKLN